MEGVRQRGMRLVEMGHQVEVVTLDDPKAAYISGYSLKVHATGPGKGRYGYSSRLLPWIVANEKHYDVIVVNGLWQYHGFAAWRALATKKPYFVFTHGMLDPWFKRQYPIKHLKKWLYWPWSDYRLLRDARAVLFTSQEEKLLARESFALYRARERVVAYGTGEPPAERAQMAARFIASFPELSGKRLLVFLGRIHEKKGCDLLIEAFARCADADQRLHLVIAGPDQTGLIAGLRSVAEAAGIKQRITWAGLLQGEMKWGAFEASEAFVLPSHQENFGIAVAEALACGLPVLISDKVNIWREIRESGAGIVNADTLAGTLASLQEWLSCTKEERHKMSIRALQLYRQSFSVDAMAQSLLDVIAEATPAPLLA